ncbi:hypothetical protein [Saccharothrix sp. NRRL B-16348]|nr:hypothetical protein [Saccharothrix sp. NRRL B-16348]
MDTLPDWMYPQLQTEVRLTARPTGATTPWERPTAGRVVVGDQ